jgi:hypothetical protein
VIFIVGFTSKKEPQKNGYDGVPLDVIRAVAENDLEEIAQKGERWNAGCIRQSGVPSRRFVSGNKGRNGVWTVCIEKGGYARILQCYRVSRSSGLWTAFPQ